MPLEDRVLFPFWNATERRLRAWVRLAIFTLFYFAALVVFSVIASPRLVLSAYEAGTIRAAVLYGGVGVATLVLSLGASILLDRRGPEGVGLGLSMSWRYVKDLVFGVLLGALLMGGILAAELSAGWATFAWGSPETPGFVSGTAVLATVVAFVGVAMHEELAFRGYLLTNLADTMSGRWSALVPVVVATLVSSSIFGFAHLDNPAASLVSTLHILLAGVLLAVGFIWTGRLGISIGLHLGWNLFQNLFGMPVSGMTRLFDGAMLTRTVTGPEWVTGGSFGPEAGVTGLSAITIGTLLIAAYVRVSYGPLRMHAAVRGFPTAASVQDTSVQDTSVQDTSVQDTSVQDTRPS